jgi:hypothetical protein
MDALIHEIAKASNAVKALAVTAGGLLGVFATLALFFAIILLADKVAGKAGKKKA